MNADGSEPEPSLDVPTAVLLSEGPCWGGKQREPSRRALWGRLLVLATLLFSPLPLEVDEARPTNTLPTSPGAEEAAAGPLPARLGREGKGKKEEGREGQGGSDRCCEDGDGGRGASALLPAAVLPLPQVHPHRLLHRLLGEPGVPGCQACCCCCFPA